MIRRIKSSRKDENIAIVAKNFEENTGLSIYCHFFELGIPKTSLHRILHKYLSLKT